MTQRSDAALRSRRNRARARELKRAEVLTWYLQMSGGILPVQQCEDRKSYKEKVLWWLEPKIPNVPNPIIIEEAIGDGWSLRIECE